MNSWADFPHEHRYLNKQKLSDSELLVFLVCCCVEIFLRTLQKGRQTGRQVNILPVYCMIPTDQCKQWIVDSKNRKYWPHLVCSMCSSSFIFNRSNHNPLPVGHQHDEETHAWGAKGNRTAVELLPFFSSSSSFDLTWAACFSRAHTVNPARATAFCISQITSDHTTSLFCRQFRACFSELVFFAFVLSGNRIEWGTNINRAVRAEESFGSDFF